MVKFKRFSHFLAFYPVLKNGRNIGPSPLHLVLHFPMRKVKTLRADEVIRPYIHRVL